MGERRYWLGLVPAAAVAAGLWSAPASARLLEQRIEGMRRVCTYQVRTERRSMAIGLGEPCPFNFRERRPPVLEVPSMAVLIRQQRGNGVLSCTYRYAGRNYSRSLTTGSMCPYTPQFLGQSAGNAAPPSRGNPPRQRGRIGALRPNRANNPEPRF